jgi:hypothetical protein
MNYLKEIKSEKWAEDDSVVVLASMDTPEWVAEWVEDGNLDATFKGVIDLDLRIYPRLAAFYKDKLPKLLNIIWKDGLRPSCNTPFCCCRYDTEGFNKDPYNNIEVEPLTDLDKYNEPPVVLEVFEDYSQYEYVEQIRAVAEAIGGTFEEVMAENGLERQRQWKTGFCPINFKGKQYKITYNWSPHGTIVGWLVNEHMEV